MATIIEHGALWNVSNEAAELLVEQNVLKSCNAKHNLLFPDDYPVYHLSHTRDDKVGITTLSGYINEAETEINKRCHDNQNL